jgi:hypothetical protein
MLIITSSHHFHAAAQSVDMRGSACAQQREAPK